MLSTRRSQLIVTWIAAAFLALFILGATAGDEGDDTNPVTKSASSTSLDESPRVSMELTSVRQDGTEYCVSFAATGKLPHVVILKNCGPTAVNLAYDGLDKTLVVGEKKTIDLDYDYTEFSVAIEALDGEYIGGFQP